MFATTCFFYDITKGNELILMFMWRWKVFAMWFESSLLKHGKTDPFCALHGFLYLVLSRCGLRPNNVISKHHSSCSFCMPVSDHLNVGNVAIIIHVFLLSPCNRCRIFPTVDDFTSSLNLALGSVDFLSTRMRCQIFGNQHLLPSTCQVSFE